MQCAPAPLKSKKSYTAKVVNVGTRLVKDGDQQVKIHKKFIKNCADVFVVQKKKEVGLRSAVVIRSSAFKCFI